MKRRLLLILLLLVGGAVVNIAVAWGCALWSPQQSFSSASVVEATPRSWPSYLHELNWPPPGLARSYPDTGIGVTVVEITNDKPDTAGLFVQCVIRRFGLPLRALQWEIHGLRAGRDGMSMLRAARSAAGLRLGIDVSDRMSAMSNGEIRRVPVTPILSGFAINTVFYAVILWGLFAAPFALRRCRRIKRGLCPKCAYRIGESNVCTECGAAVTPIHADADRASLQSRP